MSDAEEITDNFSICVAAGLVPLCYARRLRRRAGAPRYVADEVLTTVAVLKKK